MNVKQYSFGYFYDSLVEPDERGVFGRTKQRQVLPKVLVWWRLEVEACVYCVLLVLTYQTAYIP